MTKTLRVRRDKKSREENDADKLLRVRRDEKSREKKNMLTTVKSETSQEK